MRQLIVFTFLLSFSACSYADWVTDIISVIAEQSGVTDGILDSQVSIDKDMLNTQQEMEKLINQLNKHMTSHSGYGSYQYHDYQSYGNDANDWSSVLAMAKHGKGAGDLGRTIGDVSREFPLDSHAYNRGVSDSTAQHYYAATSQTTLAARAASELDYNKIQDQIAYEKMLLQQIEKTKDIKAAMDLSNRIQVESNLINLEILRQSTFINQQQALSAQGSVTSALSNARFLTK